MFTALRAAEEVAWRERFLRSGPPIVTALLVGFQVRTRFNELPLAFAQQANLAPEVLQRKELVD